jgi:hypothetical protein
MAEARYRLSTRNHMVELPQSPENLRVLEEQAVSNAVFVLPGRRAKIVPVIQENERLVTPGRIYSFDDYARLTGIEIART